VIAELQRAGPPSELITGAYGATAQMAAPIGHRQPAAASVPDTSLGSAPKTEGRSATVVSKRSRSKLRRPLNPDVGFPDICTNCNQ
jgi:hypothetical protein